MYVCVCHAVTERQIHQAVKAGATTLKHLKDDLGVGAECGKCVTCAKACLKAAQVQQSPARLKQLMQIAPVPLVAG